MAPGTVSGTSPTVVTLPGGIVITNLPRGVLPKSPTNTVRLPTWAARRFEPLGYTPTSFTLLARFLLNAPETRAGSTGASTETWEEVRRQIPDDVLRLDGRKVALAGFLLPLSLNNGRSTEFLLLRNQSACCFGLVPRVNELVFVKMAPPGVTPRVDVAVVVAGTLRLKWIGEGGQLTGIYEIAAERFEWVEKP
jgi:hypothetical protein